MQKRISMSSSNNCELMQALKLKVDKYTSFVIIYVGPQTSGKKVE